VTVIVAVGNGVLVAGLIDAGVDAGAHEVKMTGRRQATIAQKIRDIATPFY